MKAIRNDDTAHLRERIARTAHDAEAMLDRLKDTAGDEADALKASVGSLAARLRSSAGHFEHETAAQLQSAGKRAGRYAKDRPWLVAGVAAGMIALVAGMLLRSRRTNGGG